MRKLGVEVVLTSEEDAALAVDSVRTGQPLPERRTIGDAQWPKSAIFRLEARQYR